LISTASLKSYSTKDLAQLAKKQGISGWHSMRKDQLLKALEKKSKPAVKSKAKAKGSRTIEKKPDRDTKPKTSTKSHAASLPRNGAAAKPASGRVLDKGSKSFPPISGQRSQLNGHKKETIPVKAAKPASQTSPTVVKKIRKIQEDLERRKDLAGTPVIMTVSDGEKETKVIKEPTRDRIVLLVRDSYWLHASWEVTRQSVQRAQAAMAEYWHGARPILRVLEVESNGTTSTAERVIREITIHGGVNNWYLDVDAPPRSFRVELGYLATNGRFFSMCRSNVVTTPRPGSANAIDENWADVAENYEKIYAQSGGYSEENNSTELQEVFEERLRRPMGSPSSTRFGVGAESVLNRRRNFKFEVDAEMVVFGSTKPDAHVMLGGEPVKLREDGTFMVRLNMPDKRQVIPVVACSKDGVEQRTVVLAVERNTKVMEPMVRESNSSSTQNTE